MELPVECLPAYICDASWLSVAESPFVTGRSVARAEDVAQRIERGYYGILGEHS